MAAVNTMILVCFGGVRRYIIHGLKQLSWWDPASVTSHVTCRPETITENRQEVDRPWNLDIVKTSPVGLN